MAELWYKVSDLTARLRICRSTLFLWMQEGRIPQPIRWGKRTTVWKADGQIGPILEFGPAPKGTFTDQGGTARPVEAPPTSSPATRTSTSSPATRTSTSSPATRTSTRSSTRSSTKTEPTAKLVGTGLRALSLPELAHAQLLKAGLNTAEKIVAWANDRPTTMVQSLMALDIPHAEAQAVARSVVAATGLTEVPAQKAEEPEVDPETAARLDNLDKVIEQTLNGPAKRPSWCRRCKKRHARGEHTA